MFGTNVTFAEKYHYSIEPFNSSLGNLNLKKLAFVLIKLFKELRKIKTILPFSGPVKCTRRLSAEPIGDRHDSIAGLKVKRGFKEESR